MQPSRRIATIVLATIIWGQVVGARAQSDLHPLAPPDLSSPRAALTNFLTLMDGAYSHWKSEGRTYQNRLQRAAIARVAHQFFDLSDIAPAVRNNVGRETAVYIKEVLDRIGPPMERMGFWRTATDAWTYRWRDGTYEMIAQPVFDAASGAVKYVGIFRDPAYSSMPSGLR